MHIHAPLYAYELSLETGILIIIAFLIHRMRKEIAALQKQVADLTRKSS
jgi:hypothetical protein